MTSLLLLLILSALTGTLLRRLVGLTVGVIAAGVVFVPVLGLIMLAIDRDRASRESRARTSARWG